MAPDHPRVKLVARGDAADALASLSAAFAAYPLFPWLCPDEAQRPHVVESFCRLMLNHSVRAGTAYTTPCRSAVACWLPPGREWFSTFGLLRSGLLRTMWAMGFAGSRRFARLGHAIDAARAVQMKSERHWYLNLLGVRAGSQGKGLARAVLQPVFDAADRDGVPCFLETVPEANVEIYLRLGFDWLGKRELPGGIANHEMRRTPR
jgi:GNAT superfamily N-acetyltransferase